MGNLKKIIEMDQGLTKKQLKKWKVKYHSLLFGKPVFDIYIDDKNLGCKKNWHKQFNKQIIENIYISDNLMHQIIKRKSPFLIAEIGINHNGSLKLAKKLIDLA